ncbi:MAG: hypothetical protein ACREUM_01070, partial [Nitrosospira sp.]
MVTSRIAGCSSKVFLETLQAFRPSLDHHPHPGCLMDELYLNYATTQANTKLKQTFRRLSFCSNYQET